MKAAAPLLAPDPPGLVPGEDDARARAKAERLRVIEERAIALGQTWAEGFRRDLHREGRPAAGGWPGTLREARTRVQQALLLEMQGRKMAAITQGEREIAARAAYASARSEWRRHLDPEVP